MMHLSNSWMVMKVAWDWNCCGYDLFHWFLELCLDFLLATQLLVLMVSILEGKSALRFLGYIASSSFSKAWGVAC